MSRFCENNTIMTIGQRLAEVIGVPFNHNRRGDMDLGDVVRQFKQASQDNQNKLQN
tara:strand:- start:10 stop:177 length:168 start_codon:yes stop_codon:yes gene_type:complete